MRETEWALDPGETRQASGSVTAEVTRSTGTESRLCPDKDLAPAMQKGGLCVQKWSIPAQAINH